MFAYPLGDGTLVSRESDKPSDRGANVSARADDAGERIACSGDDFLDHARVEPGRQFLFEPVLVEYQSLVVEAAGENRFTCYFNFVPLQ